MVCTNCGAILGEKTDTTTKHVDFKINYSEKPQDFQIDESIIPKNGIAIYFAETTKPHEIRAEKEFIIGRRLMPTSEPLLDLSDFNGYKMGLSRRHAMIRQTGSGYEAIDLSSTNGTWVNDDRLIPYAPHPLPSGSRLLLSRIRLFVFYRPITESQGP